jgi:hypothetical protein
MQRTLVKLVVHTAYFLTSGEEVVDPDDALRMLEYMSFTLKDELQAVELQQFLAIVDDLAREAASHADERYAHFLRSFAEDSGLSGAR